VKENCLIGSLDEIDEIDSKLNDFERVFEKSKYLGDITEDIIYQTYRTAVQGNHSKGFEDF
jgi:hypothetical protein